MESRAPERNLPPSRKPSPRSSQPTASRIPSKDPRYEKAEAGSVGSKPPSRLFCPANGWVHLRRLASREPQSPSASGHDSQSQTNQRVTAIRPATTDARRPLLSINFRILLHVGTLLNTPEWWSQTYPSSGCIRKLNISTALPTAFLWFKNRWMIYELNILNVIICMK